MARRKISVAFRSRLSEKLMDLGNLIAIALVIGQFVSGQEFSLALFIVGLALMFGCYIMSYVVSS